MHIYVHIPFCARKCPYCGFYSICGLSLEKEYFKALRSEILAQEIIPSAGYPEEEDTIYLGGGTPSYADPDCVCDILDLIRDRFSIKEGEFTIEVNPNSFDEAKARKYKMRGFNRVSIGVQSLHDDVLGTLGRLHDSLGAVNALRASRDAGFSNISADLIIGVPGQREDDVYEDAEKLINEGARHISMYSLTIEDGTVFKERYGDRLYDFFDEDAERRMYHGLRGFLSSKGMPPYEISNCAAPGYESRHNMSYWNGREYYAFGAGSHGYLDFRRFAHADDVRAYIEDPQSRIIEEVLTDEDRRKEKCLLSLRTSRGIVKADARGFEEIVKRNINRGYLKETPEGFSLTVKGLDFANLVFEDFV